MSGSGNGARTCNFQCSTITTGFDDAIISDGTRDHSGAANVLYDSVGTDNECARIDRQIATSATATKRQYITIVIVVGAHGHTGGVHSK